MQLSKSPKIDMGLFPFEIEIGPTDAGIILTQVVNPYCVHCGDTFNEMVRLIESGNGNVKGIIRFLVTIRDEKTNETEKILDYELSLGIVAMAEAGKRNQIHETLTSWFSRNKKYSSAQITKNLRKLAEKTGNWGVDSKEIKNKSGARKSGKMSHLEKWQSILLANNDASRQSAREILVLHKKWAEENGIHNTPALFVNGSRLPAGIKLEDLKYFLMRQQKR